MSAAGLSIKRYASDVQVAQATCLKRFKDGPCSMTAEGSPGPAGWTSALCVPFGTDEDSVIRCTGLDFHQDMQCTINGAAQANLQAELAALESSITADSSSTQSTAAVLPATADVYSGKADAAGVKAAAIAPAGDATGEARSTWAPIAPNCLLSTPTGPHPSAEDTATAHQLHKYPLQQGQVRALEAATDAGGALTGTTAAAHTHLSCSSTAAMPSSLTFGGLASALKGSNRGLWARGLQLLVHFACQKRPTASHAGLLALRLAPVLQEYTKCARTALYRLQQRSSSSSSGGMTPSAAAGIIDSARHILLLLSQPIMQGVLPGAELQQLQGVLAALSNHARATAAAAAGSSGVVQQAPMGAVTVAKPAPVCDAGAALNAALAAPAAPAAVGSTGTVPAAAAAADVPAAATAVPAAAAAAAAAASTVTTMSLGTLLQHLEAIMPGQANSSSSSSSSPISVIQQQLQDCGERYFRGLGASDTPAMPVVLNVFCAITDRAKDCLTAGAAAERTGEHATAVPALAADYSRVLLEVEGLLVLSGQPVMGELLGEVAGGQQGLQALRALRDQMAALCSQV